MTIEEFFQKYDRQGIDYDGSYGFQCMDLAHQFAVEVNGQDIPAAPGAKDVWTKETPGYIKITNTPTGIPQKGDIVIWGVGVGAYGHIAIFSEGDASSFTSFDQNWPLNSLCHFQKHNYNGVLGWLHRADIPQVIPQPEPIPELILVITPQTRLPLFDNKEQQQVKAEYEAKQQTITDLEDKLVTYQTEVDSLTAQCQTLADQLKLQPVSPNLPSNPAFSPQSVLGRFFFSLAKSAG